MAQQEFGDRPSQEAGNPHNFYDPVTERPKLIAKLNLIATKPTITDKDLFESIADTFATAITQLSKGGSMQIIDGEISPEYSLEYADGVEIYNEQEDECMTFGYHQSSPDNKKGREEFGFLELYSNESDEMSIDLTLARSQDGSIQISTLNEERDILEPYSVPDSERRRIVKMLLEGNEWKDASDQPIYFNEN